MRGFEVVVVVVGLVLSEGMVAEADAWLAMFEIFGCCGSAGSLMKVMSRVIRKERMCERERERG
jgi:hypothetical protein